jgi:selenocysteine lyase/cysteine desulfurase
MKLCAQLVEGLRRIDGVRLYCCDRLDNHLSTILMNVKYADPGDVGTMLDVDHDIAVRTGLHCAPLVHRQLGTEENRGGVRFSVGAFNTEAEVAAAIHAVSEVARWARERNWKPERDHVPITAPEPIGLTA